MSEGGTCCKAGSCPAAQPVKGGKTQNGKGDAPRNLSEKFRSNYDDINWGGKSKKRK